MRTQGVTQLCAVSFILMAQLGSIVAASKGELFMTVMMQHFQGALGQKNFELRITSYEDNTNVSVTVNKDTFQRTFKMNKGAIFKVYLPENIEINGNTKFDKTVIVRANKDITVLSLNQKFQSADVTIVYPFTSLGTEYFLVTPESGPPGTYKEFAIIAGQDSTSADIHLNGAVTFMGKNYAANSILKITLDSWQAVQIQSQDDLSGTRIVSTQPVAVLTGHTCAWKNTMCDHVSEQLLPVSSWGSVYMVAPLSSQNKTDIIYTVAHTETKLEYQVGMVKHTADLNSGGVLKIENGQNSVSIKANVSVQVAFYSTGAKLGSFAYDPFLMTIPSVNAYCKSYYIYGQRNYNNYALIISKTSETAGLTFNNVLMLTLKWTAITGTDYSYAEYLYGDSLTSHQVAHPSEPFGLLSIGIASLQSYGTQGTCTETATCSTITCEKKHICQMAGEKPQCVPNSVASCWASGDPHYRTFDGKMYDFQGTCTYTIVKSCGANSQLPSFNVAAKNQNRGNTKVAYISVVTVLMYNYSITLVVSEVGRVRVNGISSYLPITLNEGKLQMYQSGGKAVIKSDFGLVLFYDWDHYLRVELSGRYSESVCGMCGNNNKDPKDDMATPNGTQAPSPVEFGKSWKVEDGDRFCWNDCNGLCHVCPPGLIKKYESEGFCGLIAKPAGGPFSQCHALNDPKGFLQNCVYDVCLNDGSKLAACQGLKAYTDACQRDGVVITDWRKAARCPMECGPNSQYKICGTACPNTCEDDTASTKCGDPCVEGCECNAGFVLTLGKCVLKSTCGCTYEGLPYAQNQMFWADDKCERRCTCNPTTKQVECKAAKCKTSEKCSTVNGVRDCSPVSYGTCLASGDPHYVTYDNHRFDFQGTCDYLFSGLCNKSQDLVDFKVHVQNNHRGIKTVAFTNVVIMIVYGLNITISTTYPGRVMLNSTLMNLPYNTDDQKVSIYRSYSDVVVITDFKLKLTFDCKSRITVTLPSTYAGAVCGLCGDFNGDKTNDLTLKDGGKAPNPTAFGDSWKESDIESCTVTKPTPTCPNLEAMKTEQRTSGTDCGVLLGNEGPFRDCRGKVDPEGYFEDCIYDSCFYKGQQAIFCQTLKAYATACQAAGATVYPWRRSTFCPMVCGKNSHYEVCTSGCPITCNGLTSPVGCDSTCREGCACNDGFVLSGDQCVNMSQCGCAYNGQYYMSNEVFYPNRKCDQQCTCSDGGIVTCMPFSCGPNEECTLADGIQKCHPVGAGTSSAAGPHYKSLDGHRFDFQGSCMYTLAKSGGGDKNLTPFAINVKNEKRGNGNATVIKRVVVEVYNYTVTMIHQKTGVIQVNGVHYNLPISLLNGDLLAYQQGKNINIETVFGLKIRYDMSYQVSVTVPGNYKGEMRGLGGNYNGNKTDDFLLPDGQLTMDVNAFGAAWTVLADDTCDPATCGPKNPCITCNDKKMEVFRKKDYCGFLTDSDGPLSDCYGTLTPDAYFEDCVDDLCVWDGDLNILCQNIQSYMADCQAAGVTMKPWRSNSFCQMSCPANSTYKTCTSICDASCYGLIDPWDCPEGCAEGCECDEDYFFDGKQCVTIDRCGCYENGIYYLPDVTILRNNCTESCSCSPIGGLFCEDHRCAGEEKCTIEDGAILCIPTAQLGSVVAASKGELFLTVMMQNFQGALGQKNFELRITSYEDNTNVSVTVNKDTFQRNFKMKKPTTFKVELPENIEINGNTKFDKTVIIRANKDITVLSLNQKFQSADVTIVYPFTSLGTEYFLVTPELGPPGTYKEFAIIAGQDSTSADIHLNGAVTFMGKTYVANSILKIALDSWQAVQMQSQDDLSGTRIVSTQPVAVLTGHTCAWKKNMCDHVSEQLLPVSSWGSTYMVAPLSSQNKTDIIYTVAHTKTKLEYQVGMVKHTADLNSGGVLKIENGQNSVSIKANVSVQVVFYSTGAILGRIADDPFLMTIPSVNAYCKSYYIYGQRNYNNYALIISRTSETAGLTFNNMLMPTLKWTAITGTDYSYAEYLYGDSLTSHQVAHPSEPFGLLSIGIASIRSYGTQGTCTESPTCSENSHYELCGTGCPDTCYGLSPPAVCDAPCTEGCFCDSGYLLSGDKCVPIADCGCVYMDRYYQRGQEFYPGDLCQERCRCGNNGAIQCVNTSCTANEECTVMNGVLGCHPSGYGMCVAAGDSHYLSFDGQAFDFQGTCSYTLVTVCSNSSGPNFSVVVENEPFESSNVAVIKRLLTAASGYNITLERGMSWKVKVNGELYNLPATLSGGNVWINQEGNNIVIHTKSGPRILYDGMNYVQVKVPSTYKKQICGLCGNFNDDQSDDFLLPNGDTTQNVEEFGAAWKEEMKESKCTDGCGDKCPVCDDKRTTPYKTDAKCGLITATGGPFQNCHKLVNPLNYFRHCLYDMCVVNGTEDALCSNLQAYAAACQDAGAVIQAWRGPSSCPLKCSANSHYELCTDTCDYTCASLLGPLKCTNRCYEGCECDAGYVFDGDSCAPRNVCGCLYNGRYLKGKEHLVTPMCGKICKCRIDGVAECTPLTCGPEEVCEYRNNVIGCYRTNAKCTISMGLNFTSFDGQAGKMPSSGAFEVASVCDTKSADFFRVVVEMQQCSPDAPFPKAMVFIYFRNVFIAANDQKEAWLTGRHLPIPVTVNGLITVYTNNEDFIIEEKNKIRVIIGQNGDVTVQVWATFYGQLCGACGNFNGNPDDDLQLAGGGKASDMSQVIHSWRAPVFSACVGAKTLL